MAPGEVSAESGCGSSERGRLTDEFKRASVCRGFHLPSRSQQLIKELRNRTEDLLGAHETERKNTERGSC